MYICVCMYVCMYDVCMYVCLYVRMYSYQPRQYNLEPRALRCVQHIHKKYPSTCSHIVQESDFPAVTLGEGSSLRVFDNGVLRETFVPKRQGDRGNYVMRGFVICTRC